MEENQEIEEARREINRKYLGGIIRRGLGTLLLFSIGAYIAISSTWKQYNIPDRNPYKGKPGATAYFNAEKTLNKIKRNKEPLSQKSYPYENEVIKKVLSEQEEERKQIASNGRAFCSPAKAG